MHLNSFGGRYSESAGSTSPGPGTYEAKQIVGREGTNPTMIGRRPQTANFRQFTPGPGAYTPDKQRNSAPAFKLGTGKRASVSREKVPGPGTYNPIVKLSKLSTPGWR